MSNYRIVKRETAKASGETSVKYVVQYYLDIGDIYFWKDISHHFIYESALDSLITMNPEPFQTETVVYPTPSSSPSKQKDSSRSFVTLLESLMVRKYFWPLFPWFLICLSLFLIFVVLKFVIYHL
jgi:hypothetical protein